MDSRSIQCDISKSLNIVLSVFHHNNALHHHNMTQLERFPIVLKLLKTLYYPLCFFIIIKSKN